MELGTTKFISGKNVFSQIITVIGGILVLLGIWTAILYVQTEPYYKFNSEEYLTLIQKIETKLEQYKSKIETITSGSETINQNQAAQIDSLMRNPESQIFTVTLDNNVKSSNYSLNYLDFIYYNKNYKKITKNS
jgi:hypothetical protein